MTNRCVPESYKTELVNVSSILTIFEKALRTDERTYGRMYGWTDPLIEMRGRIGVVMHVNQDV